MKRCIEIAQDCVNIDPHKRPTTDQIIDNLNETETVNQKDHAIQIYQPIVNEPINDPKSSLHQIVQRFQALPAVTVWDNSRSNNLEKGMQCLLGAEDSLNTELSDDLPQSILEGRQKPGKLPYHLLQFITGNFSGERKIGNGGSAVVFRGILRKGNVAVKRILLNGYLDVAEKLYQNEVKVMMSAQHKNIVQFLGYCHYTEGEATEYLGEFVMAERLERLLCFEYLSNGSLYEHLSDASCGVEWRERYQIIKGICEGLHYLHGKRILHLDLKPHNILLDDNKVPKIAGFCLSRFLAEDQSQTITRDIFGSPGYIPPEFMASGVVSFKFDIFCLGVIIRDLLTGHECPYFATDEVLEIWRSRLETSSEDSILLEQVRVCAEISIACMDHDPEKRPDMQRIIEMLVQTETDDGAVALGDGEGPGLLTI